MNFTTIDYSKDSKDFNDKLNLLRIVDKYMLDNFERLGSNLGFNEIVEEIYDNNMLYFDSIEHVEIIYRDYLENYLGKDFDEIEEKDETDYKLVFDDILFDLREVATQSYELVYDETYNLDYELFNYDCFSYIVKYHLSEKANGCLDVG